jgi:hypothetical protein
MLLILLLMGGLALFATPDNKTTAIPSTITTPAVESPTIGFFPVPSGSTVAAAASLTAENSGYQIFLWQSGADYAATVDFYQNLQDTRWQLNGNFTVSPTRAIFALHDQLGVFLAASVEVAQTSGVQIIARFLLPPTTAPGSLAPGPTLPENALPNSNILPADFPTGLIPDGATLTSAGSDGAGEVVLFTVSVDLASYRAQLANAVQIIDIEQAGAIITITFLYQGRPGQVLIDSMLGQVTVEISAQSNVGQTGLSFKNEF